MINDKISILITGASGFVGTALVKKFESDSYRVYSIDSSCDITDHSILFEHFENIKIDYIFHLAAYSTTVVENYTAHSLFDINVNGTNNLMKLALHLNVKCFFLASTSRLNNSKNINKEVCNLYDVSKLCAEKIAFSTGNVTGLRVVSLRMCNIFGPGDFNYSRFVPSLILSLVKDTQLVLRDNVDRILSIAHVDVLVKAIIDIFLMVIYEDFDKKIVIFESHKKYHLSSIARSLYEFIGKDTPSIFNSLVKVDMVSEYEIISDDSYRSLLTFDIKESLVATYYWYLINLTDEWKIK
jgi:nucleoside-diphosphate-sugar epimerase